MPRKRVLKLRCPICKKVVKNGDAEFPFCSDRCRTIDLGKWASGAYVIASPVTDADEPIREGTPEDRDEDRDEE
ncbi:MAG: DNA gyrase inhibitor YacG [Candidatus Sulfotelmatobacter sp.]